MGLFLEAATATNEAVYLSVSGREQRGALAEALELAPSPE